MKKSNFYLLYSGDKSLLSNEVNKLKKNLNITSDSIYYDIENVSDIIVEASTIGMFDPYKFIVIDSGSYFLQKSEFDISLLEEYFNNYNTNSYLIFILNSGSVDSKKKLYKLINDNGTINRESLRKNSRNFYQFSNGGLLPTIIDNNQPEYLRKPIGDTSRRAKMIYTFETISPRELLINKNNGNEPTRRDLKLIEDLLVDYKLKPGVVNVLLDYAINVNNKKLTRGFVETIAGEWQRKGIETVEDAMNNCEKVHKKSSKRNYKDDNVNMKTPDWFDKEIDKSNVSDGEENQLEELLKEYK